jgi:hypothetical protein
MLGGRAAGADSGMDEGGYSAPAARSGGGRPNASSGPKETFDLDDEIPF